MSTAHVPRFFVPGPLQAGACITLDAPQSHHLVRVLRAGTDGRAIVFDGRGGEWQARVSRADRAAAELTLDAHHEPGRESALELTLAQGIARGDRMDQALAKAVELGVAQLQPLFCGRGKVRLDASRAQKKQAHWQRAVQSAAEQSGRTHLPRVAAPLKLDDWLRERRAMDLSLVLDPRAPRSLADFAPAASVTLLIGPESGLLDSEIDRACAQGFEAVSLGPRTLRTETAGPACLAALQTLWGDFSQVSGTATHDVVSSGAPPRA